MTGPSEGRLAHKSFLRRLDLALRARDRKDLDALVTDLPGARLTRMSGELRTRLITCADQVTAGLRVARLPGLPLPSTRQPVVTVGRLNGLRIRAATVVRPGDRVGFGGLAFRVVPGRA